MAQQETPIYWDQPASRWNLTLIFALVVAVLGLMTGMLLTALGLAMAAYSWLTTPRQFLLYRDRMMIIYGIPRTRVIPFADISHAEVLALPFGQRLRLVMNAGNRMMLSMRDPMSFRNNLEEALQKYNGEQTGEYFVEGRGTVLGTAGESEWAHEGEFNDVAGEHLEAEEELSEEEARASFYAIDPAEPETYTGTVHEAASTSGSYVEMEAPPAPAVEPEPEPALADQSSSTSGSYTESAEPDFSGEGTPAYGAEVEVDTSVNTESEEERPPSPY